MSSNPGHCLVLIALLTVGCSDAIRPPTSYPVTGTVKLNGKPAAGIRVKFYPQFEMGEVKYVPEGETGPQGTFVLSTGAPGNGAPPGVYVVTFEKPEIESARESNYLETEIDALQGKYSNPEDGGWLVTVEPRENQFGPFELE